MAVKKMSQMLLQKVTSLFKHSDQSKSEDEAFVTELIGKRPHLPELYTLAFTHRSYPKAPKGVNNERLEFLGDSVLSCAVGAILYEMFEDDEGALTAIRAQVVSRSNLNAIALRMGIDKIMRASGGLNFKQSDTPGNGLEALIGAIYLDQGYDFALDFIRKEIVVNKKNIKRVSQKEEDYKTEFIILMQQKKIPFDFSYIDSKADAELGIVHRCEIRVGSPLKTITTGVATSKKQAHQNAAKDALRLFRKNPKMVEELAKSAEC